MTEWNRERTENVSERERHTEKEMKVEGLFCSTTPPQNTVLLIIGY